MSAEIGFQRMMGGGTNGLVIMPTDSGGWVIYSNLRRDPKFRGRGQIEAVGSAEAVIALLSQRIREHAKMTEIEAKNYQLLMEAEQLGTAESNKPKH